MDIKQLLNTYLENENNIFQSREKEESLKNNLSQSLTNEYGGAYDSGYVQQTVDVHKDLQDFYEAVEDYRKKMQHVEDEMIKVFVILGGDKKISHEVTSTDGRYTTLSYIFYLEDGKLTHNRKRKG